MPHRPAVISADDVAMPTPEHMPGGVGVRYSMDFAEDAHAKLGQEAIVIAIERLSGTIVYENEPAIRRAVEHFLHDRGWAEPIIREAIRETVREFILDMMGTSDAARARVSGESDTP